MAGRAGGGGPAFESCGVAGEGRSSVPSMAREGSRTALHRFSMEFEGSRTEVAEDRGRKSEARGRIYGSGKGWAVRQSVKNNYEAQRRLDMRVGAEGVNMGH